MRWFGPTWDAPVNEDTNHAPTPVGWICGRCGHKVRADEQGLLIPTMLSEGVRETAYHRDCFLKAIGVTP